MKLFVTGATGFVGSHFINKAQEAGHEFIALKRSGTSYPRIFLLAEPVWLEKALDVVDTSDFEGVDAVVHLAAHTPNVPYDTLENCLYWNVNAVVQLIRTAYQAGVRRFIVAGSCFEYGLSAANYENIPADAPLEPVHSYPASKAAASVALIQMARELKLEFSLLRIFQVFGEGEAEGRLWPSLKKAALSGQDFEMTAGEQVRDFTPVEFVADEFVRTLGIEVKAGVPDIRNLGTGRAQTLLEFSRFWWEKWGAPGQLKVGAVPYRDGEVMRFVPEIRS